MKKSVAMMIGCLSLAGLSGCCNITAHASDTTVPAGMYSGTREILGGMVILTCGPFGGCGCYGATFGDALVCLPLCLADFPLEVVADTIMLPYDAIIHHAAGEGMKEDNTCDEKDGGGRKATRSASAPCGG